MGPIACREFALQLVFCSDFFHHIFCVKVLKSEFVFIVSIIAANNLLIGGPNILNKERQLSLFPASFS